MAFNILGTPPPQQGLGFAGDPVKKPFDVNSLLGNPLLHAGIAMLGSRGNQGLQAGLQGAMQGAQYKAMLDKQAKAKADEAALQSTLEQAQQGYAGGDQMVTALLGNPQTYQSGVSILGKQTPATAPSNVREWEAFSVLTPEQQQQYLTMKRAAPAALATSGGYVQPNIQNPAMTAPVIGVGGQTALPVAADVELAGEKKAAEIEAKAKAERSINQPKALAKLNTAKRSAANVLDAIKTAKANVSLGTTGLLGAVTRGVPGTAALDLVKTVETVKANLGFDRLQQMRDESPTGGALGQVAVQELEALQSVVANLDTSQSEAQMMAALEKIERHYQNYLNAIEQSYQNQYSVKDSGAATGIITDPAEYLKNAR